MGAAGCAFGGGSQKASPSREYRITFHELEFHNILQTPAGPKASWLNLKLSIIRRNYEKLFSDFFDVYSWNIISQELKTLKCRQCALKQIKAEVFQTMPRLAELDLGANQFRSFENELAALKSLKILILDHNKIHEITNRLFSFHHKSLEHLGE